MARFQKGDETVDIWVEERGDKTTMHITERGETRELPLRWRFSSGREYRALQLERLRAGWRRVRDDAHEPDLDDEPRNPELEAALVADPSDRHAALVYADWYQQQEHPRGDLIAVQCALSERPGDPELVARERDLLAEWEDHLLGPLADHDPGFDLVWEHGFIKAARLVGKGDGGEERLWDLLRHPSARFLRELVIGCHQYGDQANDLMAALLLDARPTPPLRKLRLADFDDSDHDNIDISRAPLGDLTGLGARYPQLEDVILKGRGDCGLADLALLRAKRFALRTSSLDRGTLASILGAEWPALEELELWFGDAEYGGNCTPSDLAPLLRPELAPRLRVLRLMNAELAEELCRFAADLLRARPIRVLDFSLGALDDTAANQLLANRGVFAKLEALHVFDCCLSQSMLGRLRAAGLPIVDTHPPECPAWFNAGYRENTQREGRRYVSVTE